LNNVIEEVNGWIPDELVNKIICGDCVDLMADLLPDNCIDLTVTSPPYDNIRSYEDHIQYFDFEAIADQLCRVTAKGGVIVWVVGDQTKDGTESGTSFSQALHFKKLGMLLHDTMIYKRGCPYPPNVRYWQEFEYMFILSKGPPKTFNPLMQPKKESIEQRRVRSSSSFNSHNRGRDGELKPLDSRAIARIQNAASETSRIRSNIWEFQQGGGKSSKDKIAYEHPAIFPEQLAHDHILSWSNPGDLCFDPMCGSGTVAKQSKLLKRNYLGFDVVQTYVDLANRRLDATQAPLMVM